MRDAQNHSNFLSFETFVSILPYEKVKHIIYVWL